MATADELLNNLFQNKWNLPFVLYDGTCTSIFESWNHASQSFTEFVHNLWICKDGILNPNDSICQKQTFPLVKSLRLIFYEINTNILLRMVN